MTHISMNGGMMSLDAGRLALLTTAKVLAYRWRVHPYQRAQLDSLGLTEANFKPFYPGKSFAGLEIITDALMPKDKMRLEDKDGKILVEVYNIGPINQDESGKEDR